ncbi:MAG: glycosyltransferase family 4 protein [Candidatus Competibacteraceae bacterium]
MRTSLRFCMITTFYPPYNFGGDGIFVRRLSNELARRGHQVEVIHCIDSYLLLAGREPAGTYDDHPNVTIHGLRSRFGPLSPLATQQTGLPFFKRARIQSILQKGFDVIHYHNISLVGGPGILAYGQGIKLLTTHDYWLVCPAHVLFKFNRAVCAHPTCLPCTLVHKRPPQWWRYGRLLERMLAHVDTLIAPSLFSAQTLRQRGLELPGVHLPNFISEEPAVPGTEWVGDSMEVPYFLYVGRLEKIKGVQTLIPLFRNYSRARLLIAGTGDYEPFLRRLADGSTNIRFLGHLSAGRLQACYQQAMALIVPSLWFEVCPLVILEAFQQGTPVIVRNLGAMPELIAESGGGFSYTNESELLTAMERLLENKALRDDLGYAAYRAYQAKWTAEVHLQHYLTLIEKIRATSAAHRR